jgi:hypothetical protein
MMADDAARSYRKAGTPASDQAAVWNEVARKMEAVGATSPSGALHAVYQHHAGRLKEWEAKATVPPECTGAVFVVGENIVGADLFDKPETLGNLWPKLIKSCAIDALESSIDPKPLQEEYVSGWLKKGLSAPRETFPSAGVGVDMRIEGDDCIGASLVVEDRPVHTELFRGRQSIRAVNAPLQFPQPADSQRPDRDAGQDNWLRRLFRK